MQRKNSEIADVIIDSFTPISNSLIWTKQADFYRNSGIKAWTESAIPYWATSNPTIAKFYAELVFYYINELIQHNLVAENETIYIIEPGAGLGQFAYLFLKYFDILRTKLPQNYLITYVLTDISEQTLVFFKEHNLLLPFIEKKHLDIACFDAINDTEIHLKFADKTLSSNSNKNPLIVLANYVFDSLPSDRYTLKNTDLFQTEVQISSPSASASLNDYTFKFKDSLYNSTHQKDTVITSILNFYRSKLSNTSFQIPTGGFKMLNTLLTLSNQNLLLISADKALCFIDELKNATSVPPIIHNNAAVSYQVNFNAIELFFNSFKGKASHSPNKKSPLDISVFYTNPHNLTLKSLNNHFSNIINENSAVNLIKNASQLEKNLVKHSKKFTLSEFKYWLESSYFDPFILQLIEDFLYSELKSVSEKDSHIWLDILCETFKNFYPTSVHSYKFPFTLARLCCALNQFKEAIPYLKQALKLNTTHVHSLFYMGVCYCYVKKEDQANHYFQAVLDIEPSHSLALKWQKKLSKS